MLLKINNNSISENNLPYIIAEIGSNYDQDKTKAFRMIEVASKCGVNAVKFQVFKANKLYKKSHPMFKIFKKLELNTEWLSELSNCAKKNKVTFLASVFDLESVDHLEKINIPAYKIASSEISNHELLKYVANKKKTTIISTGMSDYIDIEYALNIFKFSKNNKIALMQCSALYPCSIKNANLNVISSLKSKYNLVVGFSDHTIDNSAAPVAVGLGASIFEKHFTLDKSSEGPDHFYALEPNELKDYVNTIKNSFLLKGSSEKSFLKEERKVARREGVYAKKNLKKNHLLKSKDYYFARPAIGIDSKFYKSLNNSKIKFNILKNQPIKWEDLK